MRRISLFFVIVILLLPATIAFSQIQAVVGDFRGKVEVMTPGGNWTPVSAGMVVQPGNTISTGFNSTAVLKMGLSTVTVQQLTRMTLEQLVEQNGRVTTSLGLPIGRIQAQVRSPDGGSSDFQVRSSVSTAAVRGTEFDYDGYHLSVQEGIVAMFNQLNQLRYVAAGEQSFTAGTNLPTGGEAEHNKKTGTSPGSSTSDDTSGNVTTTPTVTTSTTGSLIISW